jgi:hypothetical protein
VILTVITLYGEVRISILGEKIEKMLDHNYTTLLNDGNPTHFNTANGSVSAIDLSFSSTNILTNLNWVVEQELYNSDHWPIIIKIHNRDSTLIYKTKEKWNLKKPNWEIFSNTIQSKLEKCLPLEDKNIDEIVYIFTEIIHNTGMNIIKKNKYNGTKKSVPWWSEECKNIIKIKNKALNKFRKCRSIIDLIELKKQRAEAKYIIKNCKTNSRNTFTSSISCLENPNIVWNKIKLIKGVQKVTDIKSLRTNNNKTIITEPIEIANALGEYFQEMSDNNNFEPNFSKYKSEI